MTTLTAWAHLPNATLIDTLIARLPHYIPSARIAARDAAWVAARDAARDAARVAAWDAAWDAARDAAWDAARVAAWGAARAAACALIVWDDMPAFIAMSDEELEALRVIGADTDIAHRAFCALAYKEITS